jgi:hypothetical protein
MPLINTLTAHRLMFPHKAAFNASFARGVLFLDEVDGPET